MTKITLGLIQSAAGESKAENIKKTVDSVRLAAKKGAKVICLQELFATKYFPREERKDFSSLAETIPSKFSEQFSTLAKELKVVLIVPFYEKKGKEYFNSAAVFDADGTPLEIYRKHHIPHDQLFYEKNYFKESNESKEGYIVYKTRYGPFSVLICYDQWFPEAARICALKGAEIIFYPTAIGNIKGHEADEGDWREAWETIQRGHAIANSVVVAAVNRVGEEKELQFWGGSFVCDAFGNVLKRAGDKEEILIVDVDTGRNKEIRDAWGFMRNRRPETYGMISKK